MRRALILALCALAACHRDRPLGEEGRLREAYVKKLVARENVADLWLLSSREDVILDEGLSSLEMDDNDLTNDDTWFMLPKGPPAKRGIGRRWMGRRIRIQVHGDGSTDMRLELRGHANLRRLYNRPRIAMTFDGNEIHSALVEPDGSFTIKATIPRASQNGWSDVYVILSSIHEPVVAPEVLRVAQLEAVVWEPVEDRAPGAQR